MDPSKFREQLRLAQAGDAFARDRLFESCRSWLKEMVLKQFGGLPEATWEASDTVQESMLQAHRDFHRFRGQHQEEFQAWLQTIARHDATDRMRYQTRKKRQSGSERSLNDGRAGGPMLQQQIHADQSSASQRLMSRERQQRILTAIDELPADQATAMRMRHIQGLTLAEISTLTGRSHPAVVGLLTRGTRGISARLRITDG